MHRKQAWAKVRQITRSETKRNLGDNTWKPCVSWCRVEQSRLGGRSLGASGAGPPGGDALTSRAWVGPARRRRGAERGRWFLWPVGVRSLGSSPSAPTRRPWQGFRSHAAVGAARAATLSPGTAASTACSGRHAYPWVWGRAGRGARKRRSAGRPRVSFASLQRPLGGVRGIPVRTRGNWGGALGELTAAQGDSVVTGIRATRSARSNPGGPERLWRALWPWGRGLCCLSGSEGPTGTLTRARGRGASKCVSLITPPLTQTQVWFACLAWNPSSANSKCPSCLLGT